MHRPTGGRLAWLNVGCGTHHAPPPWWSIDVVYDEASGTLPDEVVARGPLPFEADTCSRVLFSHLMEHVAWGQPLLDVMAEARRVLAPGGTLLAVGPDARRTAEMWKRNQVPDELMWSVFEHANGPHDLVGDWPEARHWWNCTEERMVMALQVAGFADVRPLSLGEMGELAGAHDWPLIGLADWQCGAICTGPPA